MPPAARLWSKWNSQTTVAAARANTGKPDSPSATRGVLTVPRSSLVERGQLEGLFVVNAQGVVEYRLVKTGKSLGDRVEILSGLTEGERVATSKTVRLSDGVRAETR